MKLVLFLCFLTLWSSGFCDDAAEEKSPAKAEKSPHSVFEGAKVMLTGAVDSVVSNWPFVKNTNDAGCVKAPLECPNINITFWYYTRETIEEPVEVSVTNYTSIQKLPGNEYPWKVIIQGYGKGRDEFPNPQLVKAYFQNSNYNVLVVDYSKLAQPNCYADAVYNAPLISNCTAQLLDALMDKSLFRSDNLHVIGFSLGAHIAGTLYEFSRHVKPHRVSGLDPAAPLFDSNVNEKISERSADFVDIIHTNALMKGKLERLGHVDFYVNGGIHQTGCGAESKDTYSECSHERSALYFAESIVSKDGFYGIPCDSYMKFYSGFCDTTEDKLVLMGERTNYGTRGTFYLETASKTPFALGKRPNVISLSQRMQESSGK